MGTLPALSVAFGCFRKGMVPRNVVEGSPEHQRPQLSREDNLDLSNVEFRAQSLGFRVYRVHAHELGIRKHCTQMGNPCIPAHTLIHIKGALTMKNTIEAVGRGACWRPWHATA